MAHAALAGGALGLGSILLVRRKGTLSHRVLGWVWIALMATVALTSFAIQSTGTWSWIHGFSVLTPLILVYGIYSARTHNVRAHKATMLGLFFGALVITGLFTLLPNRLIGDWLWQ
jgi:uncharacterized membrane protein